MKVVLTAGLLSLCLVAVAYVIPREERIKLCGEEFEEALANVCGGDEEHDEPLPPEERVEDEMASETMQDTLREKTLQHIHSRICCQIGCTAYDLKQMCGYPVL